MTRTRTTLAIDDDVLAYAREYADGTGASLGEVISRFARTGINRPEAGEFRNGIKLLPSSGKRSTLEDVNRLRDELP